MVDEFCTENLKKTSPLPGMVLGLQDQSVSPSFPTKLGGEDVDSLDREEESKLESSKYLTDNLNDR